MSVGTIVDGYGRAGRNKINTVSPARPVAPTAFRRQVVGGQVVFSSSLADAVTLAGDTTTLTAIGYASGNRNSTVGTVPPGTLAATLDGSNHLVLESSSADNAIDIASTSPNLLSELGLQVGTIQPTNLLGTELHFGINEPPVLIGLLLGGLMVCLFASLSIEAVGRAGGAVVEEVRRQFREHPGSWRTQKSPNTPPAWTSSPAPPSAR